MKSVSPESIDGVEVIRHSVFRDPRGEFTEVFRLGNHGGSFDDQIQVNCTRSRKGTIRGLHFHRFQTDIWFPASGLMRAAMVDLRPESATYRSGTVLEIDAADPTGLLIPPGVAHGYLAVTDSCLLYVVNRYYDGGDEHGLAWDDPELDIDWGIDSPILSDRDMSNPGMTDMTTEWLTGLFTTGDTDR